MKDYTLTERLLQFGIPIIVAASFYVAVEMNPKPRIESENPIIQCAYDYPNTVFPALGGLSSLLAGLGATEILRQRR